MSLLKKKRMARIKVNKENCFTYADSIVIRTIYKNVWVPAAAWSWENFDEDIILVDEWCFRRHGLNPCQIVSGYIDTVTV